MRTGGAYGVSDCPALVRAEIVHDDDVVGLERRDNMVTKGPVIASVARGEKRQRLLPVARAACRGGASRAFAS